MALLKLSRHGRAALAYVSVTCAFTNRPLRAQSQEVPEYAVKAAYLLNFTRYVEWPPRAMASPRTPIVLCVHGVDPFGELLERTVAGRTSRGRTIEVRRTETTAEARACHAVFLARAEWRRRPDVLGALAGHGILTIGETAAFTEAGGVIGFVLEQNAVRFAVNLAAAERAGLEISSRMLAIATKLQGQPRARVP